jgi:hypothetical protein
LYIFFFMIFPCSHFFFSLSECIVSWEWHPSNVTEYGECILFGKFFYYFPFWTENLYLYFQARICLKTLFSASRYAILAFRYSTVSVIGGLSHGVFHHDPTSFFFLHFFHSLSHKSQDLRMTRFHALRLSFGTLEVIMYSGNPSVAKTSRAEVCGMSESSKARCLHS